eukprot:COSAG01_NODE_55532_length_324_cov_1.044444_1_plen_52_part_10
MGIDCVHDGDPGGGGARTPARRITNYNSQINQQCAVRVRERVCIHEHFILSL